MKELREKIKLLLKDYLTIQDAFQRKNLITNILHIHCIEII